MDDGKSIPQSLLPRGGLKLSLQLMQLQSESELLHGGGLFPH